MPDTSPSATSTSTHLYYLSKALSLGHLSPPKPTNFRVGCVLVSFPLEGSNSSASILTAGYTLELHGNTHAEQNALTKLALQHQVPETRLHQVLTAAANVTLYTTLEPCSLRLSGNASCVHRIIATRTQPDDGRGIRRIVFGAKEPGTFVQNSQSCRMLTEAGVEWIYVPDMEKEILEVAMAGHQQQREPEQERAEQSDQGQEGKAKSVELEGGTTGTNISDISAEERQRQALLPRNPKKRMMEVPPRES